LSSKQQTPRNLSWYLCSALHHRLIRAKRGAARRERAHQASTESLQEGATTSEYAIQSIANPLSVKEGLGESALSRLATLISKKLSADERQLLMWCAEMVPRREIAEWLGITHEAAKKRVLRACRHAKVLALQVSQNLSDEDRATIERFLRRTGASDRRQVGGG
jgi:DNA-directed RNA polymerase specialized sigma24 family protein